MYASSFQEHFLTTSLVKHALSLVCESVAVKTQWTMEGNVQANEGDIQRVNEKLR